MLEGAAVLSARFLPSSKRCVGGWDWGVRGHAGTHVDCQAGVWVGRHSGSRGMGIEGVWNSVGKDKRHRGTQRPIGRPFLPLHHAHTDAGTQAAGQAGRWICRHSGRPVYGHRGALILECQAHFHLCLSMPHHPCPFASVPRTQARGHPHRPSGSCPDTQTPKHADIQAP